jgi:hypothetical protein
LVNNQKMALFKHSENISIAVEDWLTQAMKVLGEVEVQLKYS